MTLLGFLDVTIDYMPCVIAVEKNVSVFCHLASVFGKGMKWLILLRMVAQGAVKKLR